MSFPRSAALAEVCALLSEILVFELCAREVTRGVLVHQSWSWVTFSKPNPTQNFWTQPNPTHKSLHPTQPNLSSTL